MHPCNPHRTRKSLRTEQDFRNRIRNVKFNLEKKERCVAVGAGAGSYSVPSHITARVGVRDSLASWKMSTGFSGGNVAEGGRHSPFFIVTWDLQEDFACKSLLLLYTF